MLLSLFRSLTSFIVVSLFQNKQENFQSFLFCVEVFMFLYFYRWVDKINSLKAFFYVSENCDSQFFKHILENITDQRTRHMAVEWTVFLWRSCSCCKHNAFLVLVLLLFLRYNHAKIYYCAVAVLVSCKLELQLWGSVRDTWGQCNLISFSAIVIQLQVQVCQSHIYTVSLDVVT